MIVGVEEVVDGIQVLNFNLMQNYPNPFHSMTVTRYFLSEPTQVSLKVFDISGRLVKTLLKGVQGAGSHKIYWDAKNQESRRVPSGVYFYQLRIGSQTITKKLVKLGYSIINQGDNQYA